MPRRPEGKKFDGKKTERKRPGLKKIELKRIDRNRLRTILVFLIKFNLLALPMYLVIYSGMDMKPLRVAVADMSFKALNALGFHVYRYELNQDYFYIANNYSYLPISIDLDCTAWKSMYALAALMIATPFPNDKRKLQAVAAGVAAIFFLNIVRIVTTIGFSLVYGVQYLDVIHTVLWREGMILAVIGIWVLWIKARKKEDAKGAGDAKGAPKGLQKTKGKEKVIGSKTPI